MTKTVTKNQTPVPTLTLDQLQDGLAGLTLSDIQTLATNLGIRPRAVEGAQYRYSQDQLEEMQAAAASGKLVNFQKTVGQGRKKHLVALDLVQHGSIYEL